jgi:hypothetical protein
MSVYCDFIIPVTGRYVTVLCKTVSEGELLIMVHDDVHKNDRLAKTVGRMTIIAQGKPCFTPTSSIRNVRGPSWD